MTQEIKDRPGRASFGSYRELFRSFRTLNEASYRVALNDDDPLALSAPVTRDVIEQGRVAVVVPFDPVRDEIVMLRQYRVAAELALGLGDLIELPAGFVDMGETIEEAARRECEEESTVAVEEIEHLATFLPTPGLTTENTHIFAGKVTIGELPARTGLEAEGEFVEPFSIKVADAFAALDAGNFVNGYTQLPLFWFRQHYERLKAKWS